MKNLSEDAISVIILDCACSTPNSRSGSQACRDDAKTNRFDGSCAKRGTFWWTQDCSINAQEKWGKPKATHSLLTASVREREAPHPPPPPPPGPLLFPCTISDFSLSASCRSLEVHQDKRLLMSLTHCNHDLMGINMSLVGGEGWKEMFAIPRPWVHKRFWFLHFYLWKQYRYARGGLVSL